MHSFLLLCSLLMCSGLVVSVQRKLQKVPDEEGEENFTWIRTPQTLSRGWDDEIEWVQTYEEGLVKSRNSKKPLMVIHHLEKCPCSQDPSMTVRTDLTDKYKNKMYAYEPEDISTLAENMRQAKILLHTEL